MAAYFNEKTKKWDANFTYRDFENNSRKKMKRGFETQEDALAWEAEYKELCKKDMSKSFGEFYKNYESDIKYNEELLQILMQFVEASIEYDMRGAILGNINTQSGGEKITKAIEEYIGDSSHEWVKRGKQGKLNGNLMLPYVQLYELLKKEINLLIQYKQYMDGLI